MTSSVVRTCASYKMVLKIVRHLTPDLGDLGQEQGETVIPNFHFILCEPRNRTNTQGPTSSPKANHSNYESFSPTQDPYRSCQTADTECVLLSNFMHFNLQILRPQTHEVTLFSLIGNHTSTRMMSLLHSVYLLQWQNLLRHPGIPSARDYWTIVHGHA